MIGIRKKLPTSEQYRAGFLASKLRCEKRRDFSAVMDEGKRQGYRRGIRDGLLAGGVLCACGWAFGLWVVLQ